MKEMIIGLDFGTCFSKAAIMSGKRAVGDNLGPREGIPSVFVYDSVTGENLFGDEIREYIPEDLVRHMKRLVRQEGIGATVTSGGRTFTVGEIIEGYIAFLIGRVTAFAATQDYVENKELECVVITAPVGIDRESMMASDYYRFIRSAAMKATGLDEDHVDVITEPSAAALSYFWNDGCMDTEREKTVLVFDLGGGTLDISIMRYSPETRCFDPLIQKGDLYLGGNDWDDMLADHIMKNEEGFQDMTAGEMADFRESVTQAKIELSLKEKARVYRISDDGNDGRAIVTRAMFEDITKPLCDRAMRLLKQAVESYGKGVDAIDNIVLSGGASAMAQILDGIIRTFPGYDPSRIIRYDTAKGLDPSKAIAKGAGIYAYMIMNGQVSPGRLLMARSSAKQTYGFESRNPDQENRSMVYNVIFINTPHGGADGRGEIVMKAPSNFHSVDEMARQVRFECFETDVEESACLDGRWSELDNDARPNGVKVTVPIPEEYYASGKSNEYRLVPEFRLDADGVLTLKIYDEEGRLVATSG